MAEITEMRMTERTIHRGDFLGGTAMIVIRPLSPLLDPRTIVFPSVAHALQVFGDTDVGFCYGCEACNGD